MELVTSDRTAAPDGGHPEDRRGRLRAAAGRWIHSRLEWEARLGALRGRAT